MTTTHDVERAPELRELHLKDKHDGPGAAAILSAGIGIFVLGMLTLANELSEAVHDFLGSVDLGRGVGPLAGKTTFASLAFLISWAILGYLWRGKDLNIKRMLWIGITFGIAGVLLTFPPIFTAFGS